jgi:hypothetical protein
VSKSPFHPRLAASLPRALALGLAALFASLAGCSAPGPNARQIDQLSQLTYPTNVKNVKDLDIVSTQSRTQVQFVNREPVSFHNVYVWLNRQYVGFVPKIQIGDEPFTNHYNLDRFYDLHKEHYPVGGILSPDRGFPLTSLDIYDPSTQTIYRTVVRVPENLFQ